MLPPRCQFQPIMSRFVCVSAKCERMRNGEIQIQKRQVIANLPSSLNYLESSNQNFKTGGFNRSPTPPCGWYWQDKNTFRSQRIGQLWNRRITIRGIGYKIDAREHRLDYVELKAVFRCQPNIEKKPSVPLAPVPRSSVLYFGLTPSVRNRISHTKQW